jgi:hypothetical protein
MGAWGRTCANFVAQNPTLTSNWWCKRLIGEHSTPELRGYI